MFLSFVSPRIIQEIRSIPSARLGGGGAAKTVRGCSQHHMHPALCWLLSFVGRRHHPGDVGRGEGGRGGGRGGEGVVVEFIVLMYLMLETSVSRVVILG